MKKNLLIFILVFSFALLFSAPVFAYTYSRTPAGYNSYNPVSLYFNGTYSEIKTICACADFNLVRFKFRRSWGADVNSSWIASTTNPKTFVATLPLGTWGQVNMECSIDPDNPPFVCGNGVLSAGNWFVGLPPPPPPQIFGYNSDFNTNFSASVFNFGSQLLADLRVVLYILIGLALGMGIIIFILNFFEDRKTK